MKIVVGGDVGTARATGVGVAVVSVAEGFLFVPRSGGPLTRACGVADIDEQGVSARRYQALDVRSTS